MRIQYYDNLRATACFLVILTHSALPAVDEKFGMFMVFFSLISSCSSELFVSISSSLLAPTKQPMFQFYKKRFSKLLWPFLFWSIFMVGFRYYQGAISLETAYRKILFFPIKPTELVYWFVYTISGMYLIIPIISSWLKTATKKEYQFILGLWAATLVLPYLNIIFDSEIYNIKGNYYFILVYFGGFIGYMLLGVYLRKYPIFIENKIKALGLVIMLLLIGTLPILYSYIIDKNTLEYTYNNLSLTSAFYVASVFIFFKNFKLPRLIEISMSTIAKYSFGIYLIHFLIVRDVVWKFLINSRFPHPLIETPFIAFTSLLICLIIVKLLSKLPYSNYFIGA